MCMVVMAQYRKEQNEAGNFTYEVMKRARPGVAGLLKPCTAENARTIESIVADRTAQRSKRPFVDMYPIGVFVRLRWRYDHAVHSKLEQISPRGR